MTSLDRVDVLIVGAGSAGCVLAERLSRDARRRVVLVERGPSAPVDRRLARLPIDPASIHARGFATADPTLSLVRGQGLGGSSSVNGGYFMRWHDADVAGLIERGPWSADRVARAYTELDAPGAAMSVSPWADHELADISLAFEEYWAQRVRVRAIEDRRPIVGLNRVLSNHSGRQRYSAADGFLKIAVGRPNLAVVTGMDVRRLQLRGTAVAGAEVEVAGRLQTITAAEVILCGGTLGTAEILFRSGVVDGELAVVEHREVLVRYRRRRRQSLPPAILQSVVHDVGGCEIRCYTDDFARFMDGVPALGPAVGVAAMTPGVAGTLSWVDGELYIDLGPPDITSAHGAVADGVGEVVRMLQSAEFGDIVEPDSVVVERVPSTSQHACATLPVGSATDWTGGLPGVGGLRVVDGSILPHAGRSGPHETIMMMAYLIGDDLIE